MSGRLKGEQKMEKGKIHIKHWMLAALAILPVAVILIFTVITAAMANGESELFIDDSGVVVLDQCINKDSTEAVALPGHMDWEDGKQYTFEMILPEQDSGSEVLSLLITARYMNLELYLDGKYIGSCMAKPEGAQNTRGTVYSFFKLPKDYGNKTLQIKVSLLTGPGVSYELAAPMLGRRCALISYIIRRAMIPMLLDISILCFSIILLLFGFQRGFVHHRSTFLNTGLFAAAFAVYALCSGTAYHIICSNSYLIYVLEFILLAFLPLPIVGGIYKICTGIYKKLLLAATVLVYINLIVQPVIHFTTDLEFRNTVFLSHGVILICVAILVPALIHEWRQNNHKEMAVTFAPIIIGTLADILFFYFSRTYRSALGVNVGVLLFVILETICLIRNYLSFYELNLQNKVYQKMAYTDALTGLGNRAAFEEQLKEFSRDISSYSSLWCVCTDVNGLKQVNDHFGHSAGDELIRAAAQSLKQVMCEVCALYRTGGDEFVMFIPSRPEQDILDGIEKLNKALESYNETHEIKLSVALGYDCFRFGCSDTVSDLISRADQKMYEDKRRMKEAGTCQC